MYFSLYTFSLVYVSVLEMQKLEDKFVFSFLSINFLETVFTHLIVISINHQFGAFNANNVMCLLLICFNTFNVMLHQQKSNEVIIIWTLKPAHLHIAIFLISLLLFTLT